MTFVTPGHVRHRPPGDHVWTGGVLDEVVTLRAQGRDYMVAVLCADECEDRVRIVGSRHEPLLVEDAPVMVAGYVEHPADGSEPVVIVTRVVRAGFDD